MKQKLYIRSWLLVILSIITITSRAQNVKISGYSSSISTANGYPLFLVNPGTILVSSSSGAFDYIFIDNSQIAYKSDLYWTSYEIDITSYWDGKLHSLQLKRGSENYGICYFTVVYKEDAINGIYYKINGDVASVIRAVPDISNAIIAETFSKDGVSYPVTSIGNSAFSGCSRLSSITIPSSISIIGASAFNGCASLKEVIISDSEKSIEIGYGTYSSGSATGKGLFSDCPIESLYIGRNYTITNYSPSYPYDSYPQRYGYSPFPPTITTLTLGNNVTTIPAYFLYNGSKIESLTIPNSVTSIGKSAFNLNTCLNSLTIGSGVLSIGVYAFPSRTSSGSQYYIPKVIWMGNTPPTGVSNVKALQNYVANNNFSCSNQKVYQFLSSIFEVDNVVYVPVSPSDRTCDVIDCNYTPSSPEIKIDSIVKNKGIELKVLEINNYAFYKNSSIANLTVSNTGNIGNDAFYDCDALKSVVASNDGYIGQSAFYDCDALESVVASNNGYIGQSAFYDCNALKSVVARNDGYIGQSAFYDCDALESVVASNNGYIGQSAFYDCDALESVVANNNGYIGQSAFYDCDALESVVANNNGYIGQSAFYDCDALISVTASNHGNIQDDAFRNCDNLKTVELTCVGSIGSSSFRDCKSLETALLNIQGILETMLFKIVQS